MMFCKNCGAQLEDSVTFCTQCGVRVTKPVPAEAAPVGEAPPILPVPAPEPSAAAEETRVPEEGRFPEEPRIPAREFTETHSAPPMSGTFLPPPTAGTEKSGKEKTFFGVGALIFCLVMIGALSIATGVFAGLYFSAIA